MTDSFIFESYKFDEAASRLRLAYRYENGPGFEEIIEFPKPQALTDDRRAAFDHAARLLFLLAGVSYYKAYVPRDLKCEAFPLDRATAQFMETVYRQGLGEFAYRNKLDLRDKIKFAPQDAAPEQPVNLPRTNKSLVPVGGGKDSIVSIETLKTHGENVTLFALGSGTLAGPIVKTIKTSGLPALAVKRTLSPKLIELNKQGVYNGHVPITAILSAIAVCTAILHGLDTVVMSNEHAASAPNLSMGGIDVNHQYSKSFAFETAFAAYLASHVSKDISYFSLLRPLSEADIARRFAKLEKYHLVFRSCNTAFRQDEKTRGKNWCCDCPKCRFVFLALAPFVEKRKLVAVFGKDMLDDAAQTEGFAELCGLGAHKPFECVGEIEESALLMRKLARDPQWQRDKIVATLGGKLESAGDFDKNYQALFAPHADHRVPQHYMRMLDARG